MIVLSGVLKAMRCGAFSGMWIAVSGSKGNDSAPTVSAPAPETT